MKRITVVLVFILTSSTVLAQDDGDLDPALQLEAEEGPEPNPAPPADPGPPADTSTRAEPDPAPHDSDPAVDREPTPRPAPSLLFTPGIQVLSEYTFDIFEEGAAPRYFHQVNVPRLWLWTDWEYKGLRARVLLEGTRSADEGSLIGVGGDSIVVRFREAYAGYRAWDALEIRAGIVPTLLAPTLTRVWGMRFLAQSEVRRFEVLEPADLGATVSYDFPAGYGRLSVGLFNGEGYRFRERNRGKNTEYMLELHPLAHWESLRPLSVLAGYQLGSRGVGAVRQDRMVAGLAWDGKQFGAGGNFTWVRGLDANAAVRGSIIAGWIRAYPWKGLTIGARAQHFTRDNSANADMLTELMLSVGYRFEEMVGAHLVMERWLAGSGAQSAMPGYERWRLRVVAEGRFERPIPIQLGGNE